MWDLNYKENWALKNWCFWTVVLEKTLESPLDCKEIQPIHPKGDQSGCLLEGLMLKLKLQSFGHLMWRAESFEKTLMLGKIEGRRRRGWQRMRWLDVITNSVDMSLINFGSWRWTGRPGVLRFMGLQRVEHDCATELNWTLFIIQLTSVGTEVPKPLLTLVLSFLICQIKIIKTTFQVILKMNQVNAWNINKTVIGK